MTVELVCLCLMRAASGIRNSYKGSVGEHASVSRYPLILYDISCFDT